MCMCMCVHVHVCVCVCVCMCVCVTVTTNVYACVLDEHGEQPKKRGPKPKSPAKGQNIVLACS